MSGADYRVTTVYVAKDEHSPVVNKIAAASAQAGKAQVDLIGGLGRAGDAASGIFDSMASKLMSVVKVVGAAGAATAVLGTKIGLGVNEQLESTQNSFATIFNMLGASGNFEQGLGMAKELMEGIRKDAAALPGEFQDFADMAKTLSAPLIHAGKGMADIRNLTRDTVVATASLLGTGKGAMEMGAREMAQLLEGRAGAHNTLGMRLGITKNTQVKGKDFNKATEEERFDFITKALSKAKDSLPAFQRSWVGLTSTMSDDAKKLLGTATLPLFEKLKTQFARINTFLESPKMAETAERVAYMLGKAFDYAIYRIEYFAENWNGIGGELAEFGDRLKSGFEKAWPIIEKVMGVLSKQLEDPERLIGTMLAIRGVSGLASAAPGIAKGVGMLMPAGEGAAAAGGAAVSIGVLGALAIAAVAVVGAFDVLRQDGESAAGMLGFLAEWGEGMWVEIKENFGAAIDEVTDMLKTMWQEGRPLVDLLGVFLLGAVDAVIYALRAMIAPFKMVADVIMWAIKKIPGAATAFGISEENIGMGETLGLQGPSAHDKWIAEQAAKHDAEVLSANAQATAKRLASAGKTTINNNIQMSILQENDPERFARQVSTLLDMRLRHPRRPTGMSTYLSG